MFTGYFASCFTAISFCADVSSSFFCVAEFAEMEIPHAQPQKTASSATLYMSIEEHVATYRSDNTFLFNTCNWFHSRPGWMSEVYKLHHIQMIIDVFAAPKQIPNTSHSVKTLMVVSRTKKVQACKQAKLDAQHNTSTYVHNTENKTKHFVDLRMLQIQSRSRLRNCSLRNWESGEPNVLKIW